MKTCKRNRNQGKAKYCPGAIIKAELIDTDGKSHRGVALTRQNTNQI
jgi:hypothetical protein